ncbi:adenylate/guanylate cyclase domain-containing protein, partial [Klebsiella pneumoniae]|uniref:adenylate/guanylate cyclase domain-containing protein n=1 Tax=Klebsiella pneumoniae TaxID=573 RepID=UPI003F21971C
VRMASRDGTVTLFFSDIEGSTALNDELGDRTWVRVVAWHDRVVRARVVENDGHVVKTQGDGFMVAYADAVQAVRCAV